MFEIQENAIKEKRKKKYNYIREKENFLKQK